MSARTRGCHRKIEGFTLVEMLTAVAIICVLSALLLAAVMRTRSSGDLAKCATNLHQISVAVRCYISENNGLLPGPLVNSCFYPSYRDPIIGGQLGSLIYPYLGLNTPKRNEMTELSELICPGWKRNIKPISNDTSMWKPTYPAPVYTRAVGSNSVMPTINGVNPFGYPSQSSPVPVANLAGQEATFPFLVDADQQNVNGISNLPAKPVHGKVRNVLFFDGHVEATSVTP